MDTLTLTPHLVHPLAVQAGHTVDRILTDEMFPDELRPQMLVLVNGRRVVDVEHVIMYTGDRLEVCVFPEGGGGKKGGILGSLAMIAIAFVAPFAASAILGGGLTSGAAFAAAGGSALVHAGVTAAIGIVGTLLVSALIPPPSFGSSPSYQGAQAQTSITAESPTYNIGGVSNGARINQTVPRLYGRHRIVPNMAATPQIENLGKTSEISALYDFGLGNLEIEDIKMGDLSLDVVDPEYFIHKNSFVNNPRILGGSTSYDQLTLSLIKDDLATISTAPNSMRSILDISFPSGLVRLESNGARRFHSVSMRIEYRKNGGTGAWSTVPKSWYQGAEKTKENFAFGARYNVPTVVAPDSPLDELDDVDDAWITIHSVSKDGEDITRSIRLKINGQYIYTKIVSEEEHQTKDEVRVGGRTYRRGVTRDRLTDTDGRKSTQSYEILRGEIPPTNSVLLTEDTNQPFVVSVNIRFPEADTWDIRLNRLSREADVSEINTLRDAMVLTLIRSIQSGPLLKLRKRHTMLELGFVATDKVNGVIQNISATANSILKRFDKNGFTGKIAASSNPAMVAIDLLTGESSRYPQPSSKIDWPSWNRLRKLCDESVSHSYIFGQKGVGVRYEFNGVIETSMTMADAIATVLSVCRSALVLTDDGKYGVMIDQEDNQPRQLITPENSWDFNGSRAFTKLPDILRVGFINPSMDWQPATAMVYRDKARDNTVINSTDVVEDLQTFGITSYSEAYRYGEYMMAQAIVRSETFTVSMDVENLAVRRGDRVQVQHQEALHGGMTFRVVSKPTTYTIEVDKPLDITGGWYTLRNLNGVIKSGKIYGQPDDRTLRVSDSTGIDDDAMISIGIQNPATVDYIVKNISPAEDFVAQLTLVKYDAAVYQQGILPEWNPNFGKPIIGGTALRIKWGMTFMEWVYIDRVPHLEIKMFWEATKAQGQYRMANVEASFGNEPYELIGTTQDGQISIEKTVRYDEAKWFLGGVDVRVTAMNHLGIEAPSVNRIFNFPIYKLKPEPPKNFFLDVRGEEVTLNWDSSPTSDVTEYIIRYTPKVKNPKWSSAQHLGRVGWHQTEFSAGARTGTYMIRAKNVIDKQSTVVYGRTVIEELPNLNVIKRINDAYSFYEERAIYSAGDRIEITGTAGVAEIWEARNTTFGTYRPADWTKVINPIYWDGTLSGFERAEDVGVIYSFVNILMVDGTHREGILPAAWGVSLVPLVGATIPNITSDVSAPDHTIVSHGDWSSNSNEQAVYTMKHIVNLGGVFEARIQSKIEAHAISVEEGGSQYLDLENQTPYPVLDRDQDDEWNAWLEYRNVDRIKMMSTWADLTVASVPNLLVGSALWNPWRKILVGDVTGAFFEFRIAATATKQGVLVVLDEGSVEIDMVDRTWRKNDILVPIGGTPVINFDPAFADKPTLAVTIEGGGNAVRYEVVSITKLGCSIRLYDKNDSPVVGQIDLAALGYGKQRLVGI